METKRLFFGMSVEAPWPNLFPEGRLIQEKYRHITLAFLGETNFPKIQNSLSAFPLPNFKVGFAAKFDQCLFLPPKHPHAVAWHLSWLEENPPLLIFYNQLISWLKNEHFFPDKIDRFTPHVTLCRAPFDKKGWEKEFHPLPLIIQDIHLYESAGNLQYHPVWSYPLLPPFEEIDHTADLAYLVRGSSIDQLYRHALAALAFYFPPIIHFFRLEKMPLQVEEAISLLNKVISDADQEIGSPFKAVCYHHNLTREEEIYNWEMIIDV